MSKLAENSQRVFILVIVIAFLLSSLGFTGLVIWEMTRSKKTDQNAEIQKQLQDQLNQTNKEGKLEEFIKMVWLMGHNERFFPLTQAVRLQLLLRI